MFDFFGSRSKIEKLLDRYCFRDKKAAIREVFGDKLFLEIVSQRKEKELSTLCSLLNQEKSPLLRLKLLVLVQEIIIKQPKTIQFFKGIEVSEAKRSSSNKAVNAESLISESILPVYTTFICKLCNNYELYLKAHKLKKRERGDETERIKEGFVLVNLINSVAPVSSSILIAGRYFEDYQVFIDFNIELCKELSQLYGYLSAEVAALMDARLPEKDSFLLLELVKEVEKVNEHMYLIFCNRYFYQQIKQYRIGDWVTPKEPQIRSLSERAGSVPKSSDRQRANVSFSVMQAERSFRMDPNKTVSIRHDRRVHL